MMRIRLLSPIVALIGLYKFSFSFFLAKKSMPHASRCEKDSARDLLQNVLKLSKKDVDYLQMHGIISNFNTVKGDGDIKSANGCWMPRRVDAMSVIVVDALRFDFAVEHLPNSIGSRIKNESNHKVNDDLNKIQEAKEKQGRSQLLRFVADPPTVTMQRLKGLTTGGLPTFADISGSFGGANVDEDSWIQQHHDVSPYRRGYKASSINQSTERKRFFQMAFVGDDTWIDLFPTQFDEAHPFPSFNTRDLDTVDNGCIEYLPRYLSMFGSTNHDRDSFLEVMVAHFLGVDHGELL
jgi:GPI ethanolamine phosphate transferase 3 subunit O